MRKLLLLIGFVPAVFIGCNSQPTAPAAVSIARTTSITSTSTIGPVTKASFTFSPTTPSTGQPVFFNAAGSSAKGGPVASYAWNFGDSSTASGETVTHTYSVAGTYAVTLTVADSSGGSDTFSIPNGIPVAATQTSGNIRYVNALASVELPADMSLFFQLSSSNLSTASFGERVWELASRILPLDNTYNVEGVYSTRSGVRGLVRGKFTGTVTPGTPLSVNGFFSGTMTADVVIPPGTPCTAVRHYEGPMNEALAWTAGAPASPTCPGDPLFYNSFTLLKSVLPAATTTVPPASSTTTTISGTTSTTTTTVGAGNITITGVVGDTNGSPLASASVQIINATDGTTRNVVTQTDGSYSAAGFSAGTMIVTASATGYVSDTKTVNASGSQTSVQIPAFTLSLVTKPSPPTGVVAVPGPSQAVVSWTVPASTGGAPILDYTVTPSPSGNAVVTTSTSATVMNLVNGTAYTFTVTARNIAGSSLPSDPSSPVSPISVPAAPTAVSAVPGDAQATVTFTPPVNPPGNPPVIDYTVTSTPGSFTAVGVASPLIVPGLTNGTSYTFKVTARNSVGIGPASTASNAVIPVTIPGAPTAVTAVAGNQAATVSFTPPVSNGGSAITLYTATSNPGGLQGTAATNPVTVQNLVNNTTYTFTVTATNAVGTSVSSSPSNPVTPAATVPGTPTNVSATPGVGVSTAIISFNAPPDGGSPITNYTVTAAPGGATMSGPGSPITFTGLTPGSTYTFKVAATNSIGSSPQSGSSNSVTIPNVPAPPTGVTGARGDQQVTVTFTPGSNGGSPITGYTVTVASGGAGTDSNAGTTSLSHVVTGLTNGTAYTFTVQATNAIGNSVASAPSSPVTPSTLPGAPTITNVSLGNGAHDHDVTVTFTAPASNGGAAITSYKVYAIPGATGTAATDTGSNSPITITVATGTYTFKVSAINAAGEGPQSAASAITPVP